jgi:hypothetical protein
MRSLIRVLLFFFIAMVLLIMIGLPRLYDSRRMALAFQHHNESPSEETRREIEQARQLDRREILVSELVLAGILGLSVFVFIRVRRKRHETG